MTKILLADTTSNICSVSIFDKSKIVGNLNSKIDRSHSKLLLRMIDDLLKKHLININDIDAFSISKGPGSYTGLRIGVSSFKGLCYSLEKPLISINTLELLSFIAQSKINKKNYLLCPMIDARRMEVYTRLSDRNFNIIIQDCAMILDSNSFKEFNNHLVYFFGSGSNKFGEIIDNKNFKFISDINPESKYMGDLSYKKYKNNDFEDLKSFEPFYLKDFHLIKKKNKWIRS